MGRINEYDVFLSHNSADKEVVENIAQRLRQETKLQPFLDKWHLIPGEPWQEGLEEALDQSRTCVVFLGPSGLGPWENEEMRDALDQRVRNQSFRVIPVWLPGADPKDETTLPRFLRRLTWVDFRQGLEDKEAFHRLICGIKGIPPEPVEPQSTPKPVFPIWNVPYRQNPYFTGRKALLERLHQALITEHTTALTQPQAITGLGGIGKTQTALEYAYRHRKDYRIIWWLRAEEPTTLVADYAQLAIELNLPEQEAAEQALQIQAVRNWLEQHTDWLLIFDNAEERHNIRPYVPQIGSGQVLITSRNPIWDGLGTTLSVEVMQPEEALTFLAKRTDDPDPQAAATLAEMLGYLPLALEQAAAYIRETNSSLNHYQVLFQKHYTQLLQHDHLSTEYSDTVATTWKLSFQKVQKTFPAAADFLNLCAFLAPDVIFLDMITEGTTYLPKRLAKAITSPLAMDKLIGILLHYALVQREGNTLTVHRLVQSVLRDRLNSTTQRRWAEHAVQIVNQAFPEPKPEFTTWWTRCEQLLPHAQICTKWIERWELTSEKAGYLLGKMSYYLHEHTTYIKAEIRAEPLFQRILHILTQTKVQAKPIYQCALAIWEKGPNHRVAENLYETLMLHYGFPNIFQTQYEQIKRYYQYNLHSMEKILGPEHPHVATSLNRLADLIILWRYQDHYAEAELLYQRALRIQEKALGPDHPDLAQTLHNLAFLYTIQGRYAEAEPLYQQALTIYEKSQSQPAFYEEALKLSYPGRIHLLECYATLLKRYTTLLYKTDRYAEATALETLSQAITLHSMAFSYDSDACYTEAEPLYQQALVVYEKALGLEHLYVATNLNDLATLYRYQQQYEQAEPLYQRALHIREKALGPDHPDLAETLHNLALLYTIQGRYAEAEPLYQQALTIYEKALGPDHSDLFPLLGHYARLLRETGQDTEATDLETRAQAIRARRTEKNPTD